MADAKLTKKEKAAIRVRAEDFKRDLLINTLIDSDDENVQGALEDALVVVKLVHNDDVQPEVDEFIVDAEEEKIYEKTRVRDDRRRDKERERDYASDIYDKLIQDAIFNPKGNIINTDDWGTYAASDTHIDIDHFSKHFLHSFKNDLISMKKKKK